MLSFFSKKKIITETPTEPTIIQGPIPQNGETGGDDFIFVERKPTDVPTTNPTNMYPQMPQGYTGVPYPLKPQIDQDSTANVPYLQGVPFVLAPQLRSDDTLKEISTEVDRVLAILLRQMSVDESEMNDYNFALERSVLNEY